MPTVFAGLEDQMSDTIDEMYGELWTLLPMMDSAGGGRRVVDATRPEAVFTGAYDGPVKRSTEFGSEARGSNPRILNEPSISIDTRQFAGGGLPRRFDRIRRHETGQLYELSHGERDSENRLKYALKELIG